jgi:hypothetical protein
VYTILSAIWLTGCQLSRSARNILSIKDLLLFFLVTIEEKTLVLLSHLLGQRPLSFLLVVVATITLNLVELSYLIADFFLACFIFMWLNLKLSPSILPPIDWHKSSQNHLTREHFVWDQSCAIILNGKKKKKKKKRERKKEKPVRFKLHASLGFIQTQKLQYFVLISKGYLSFPG